MMKTNGERRPVMGYPIQVAIYPLQSMVNCSMHAGSVITCMSLRIVVGGKITPVLSGSLGRKWVRHCLASSCSL